MATKNPGTARLRISTHRHGYLVSGRDGKGRTVNHLYLERDTAENVRATIRRGEEPGSRCYVGRDLQAYITQMERLGGGSQSLGASIAFAEAQIAEYMGYIEQAGRGDLQGDVALWQRFVNYYEGRRDACRELAQ